MPRAWLGDIDIVPDATSSIYGIRWNSNNFATPRPNAVTKSHNKLVAQGYPQAVISQFDALAGYTASPVGSTYANALAGWIDSQWAATLQAAAVCGLTYTGPKPYVIIMPSAWTVPALGGLLVAGLTDRAAGTVQVVNLFPSASLGYVANTRDLLAFEYANWMLYTILGRAPTSAEEGHFACAPQPVGVQAYWPDNPIDQAA